MSAPTTFCDTQNLPRMTDGSPGLDGAQTSQANLTAHYRAPWIPNLRAIETTILDRLSELFGAPPVSEDQPPKSIFKNLSFLQGETGAGARGAAAPRKPEVRIQKAAVVDGRWHVYVRRSAPKTAKKDGASSRGWRSSVSTAARVDVDWDSVRGRRPRTHRTRLDGDASADEAGRGGRITHNDRASDKCERTPHPGVGISDRCARSIRRRRAPSSLCGEAGA